MNSEFLDTVGIAKLLPRENNPVKPLPLYVEVSNPPLAILFTLTNAGVLSVVPKN